MNPSPVAVYVLRIGVIDSHTVSPPTVEPRNQISFRANPEYRQTFAGRPRIEALTGVRWFAALFVFLSHFPLTGPLRQFCLSGYMGVTVFFVLSGFILTVTYHESLRPTTASVWNFAVARFARVYPVYALVLCYLILVQKANRGDLHGWWLHALALQPWSSSRTMIGSFNGPGWSIGVEFFFYALFPFFIFGIVPSLKSVRTSVAFAAGVALWMLVISLVLHHRELDTSTAIGSNFPESAYRVIYFLPILRLGDFLLGLAVAHVFLFARRRRLEGSAGTLAVAAAIAVVAVIAAMMLSSSLYFSAGSFDVYYAVPTAVLLYLLAAGPNVGVGWVLSLPLIVALGEASYAFYLVHVPAASAMGMDYANGGTATAVAVYVLRIGVVALLAWGIHVSIERPVRTWLRRSLSVPQHP